MSVSNVNIPTTASVFAVDARTGPNKVLILPAASTVVGRSITLKDFYGGSGSSSFTVSTVGLDRIDTFNSSFLVSTSFQSFSFLSGGNTSWATVASQVGPVPVSFLPTDIANPEVWFDASYLPNLTYDSANCNVTAWSNRGSIGVSADSNGVFPGPPKTLQYTQNGLNVISYSTSNGLQIPSMSLGNSARTCFAVYGQREPIAASRGMIFVEQQNGYNFNDFAFIAVYNSNDMILTATVNGGYCFPVAANYTDTPNNYNILSLVATAIDTGEQGVWLNGSNLNQTFYCGSENNSFPTTYNIGGGTVNIAANYNYAESLIFNSVFSTQDRQRIEGYLAWKWGIRNVLPADHPYKNTAP